MCAAARLNEAGRLQLMLSPSSGQEQPDLWAQSTKTFGFTANLQVNYRKPAFLSPGGGTFVVRSRPTKIDGRKLFLECSLENADGSTVFAEGTSLYIQPRPRP